ncbi:hypothetical protein [Acidithiobacillus ferriphilus]|uniref:hypothetical protein n=1 Tax=Acidithiobacillus ferriphilus TaxID=1689834 RepID=UPI002DBEF247|nr:hypothetical protein [Acidithiobacillus ferriphilus]MEB8476235.1 hypothetical protein [Acidithiobacillus ferriphilus]
MKAQIAIATVLTLFSAVALADQAPGFYHGTQHINPGKIQQTVHEFGAGAIRFVPPPASNGPVQVSTACGPFKYSFIHTPSPHSKAQIWRDNTGKAMSEKIINACQRGPLTISFSPIVKK